MASNTAKVRFVYCPKCRKLLTEFNYIPFYKCGGCGTILKAKNCINDAENGTSKAIEDSTIQKDEAGHDSEDNDSISSSKLASVCSTDAYQSNIDSEESRDHNTHLKNKRNSNASVLASTGHSISCRKKDPSESRENAEASGGKDSDTRSSWPNWQLTNKGRSSVCAAKIRSNYSMQSNVDKSLNEPGEISQQLGQCSGLNTTNEEGMSDPKFLYTRRSHAKSEKTRSSNNHDGSVSSSGDGSGVYVRSPRTSLSKRTLSKPQSSEGSFGTNVKPTKDDKVLNDNMSTEWGMQSQEAEPVEMSLKDNNRPHIMGSVFPEKCKSSQTNGDDHQAPEQGKMHDSEVLQAVQKWMDSQMGGPRQFPSGYQGQRKDPPNAYRNELPSNHRHQKFLCNPSSFAPGNLRDHDLDQKELLRKVEDLRDQLSRSCNLGGNEKGNEQLVCYNNNPQQEHLQFYDARNPSGIFRPSKTVSRQSGPSRAISPECAINCRHHLGSSCFNYYPNGQHFSAQFGSTSCPSKGPCMSSTGPMPYHPFNPSLASPPGHMDQNEVKNHKEKHQHWKRHCLPIAGAAPFIVCYRCFTLLQLPADFLLSRGKRHRLHCGACSKVLVFSLHNNTRIFPYSPTQVTSPTGEINSGPNSVAGNTKSISDADGFHHRDTISYSDDYSYSIPKSEFTDGEPTALALSFRHPHDNLVGTANASRDFLEQAEEGLKPLSEQSGNYSDKEITKSFGLSLDGGRREQTLFEGNFTAQVTGLPLHRLMGYSSPSEMIYSYGLQNGAEASEDLGFEILADSLSSEYQSEISEEDETLKGTYNKSNSSIPFHAKNRLEEFNYGLENKKVSVNGRVIPDRLVKKAEEKAGPIQPGHYWYDSRAGFWGVMGQACLGIIPPFIEEFSYPMRKDCAGGNTGILVNGRELHQKDLDMLSSRGLPTGKNGAFVIEFGGRVIDEASGELYNLGKLAPTIENLGCGFGMRVPLQAS